MMPGQPSLSQLSPCDHQPSLFNLIWHLARITAMGVVTVIVWLLIIEPKLGLAIVWKIVVPSLPIILALAPGFWRNICPMALMNRIPGKFGISLRFRLSDRLMSRATIIALALFVGPVAMRRPFLNDNGVAVAIMLVAAMAAAFLGGLVFARRSGWCGTFCPLGPIEKAYGLAPYLNIRSGYCQACIGCQKNCQDRIPKAAILADLADGAAWHGRSWKFFVSGLPGLIVGYFTLPDPILIGLVPYLGALAASSLITVVIFFAMRSVTGMSEPHLTIVFAMTALAIFYWFAWPVILAGLDEIFGFAAPNWFVHFGQSTTILICVGILVRALGNISRFSKT